jgi:hypothetical protein
MPAGDRTGPMGMGPMTGRAAGYCASYDVPGYANPIPGRGFGLGRGWGGGWRWRNWYHATGLPGWARFEYAPAWQIPPAWTYGPYATPPTREQEAEFLQRQAEWLREQLDAISKRIAELEKEA